MRNAQSRPQLAYLAQPTKKLPYRLLSTESRTFLRDFTRQTSKSILFFGAIGVLAMVSLTAWHMESEERKNPTPAEWGWWMRELLRKSREEMAVIDEGKKPIIDWPLVGSVLKDAVKRMEDPKYEGKGLVSQTSEAEGETLIPEVGRAGFDVSGKSWEWIAGYHEVLMKSAAAAEHLEETVLDTKRDNFFPRECMVGPSNPDPRPLPRYFKMQVPPKEEDCVPFYERPEVFYMRILTTKGFDTRQKLEAVEGYANYLIYKGLNESAEEMYRWGIDIAKASLPGEYGTADAVIDSKTNVLTEAARRQGTENLLRATTNLATHFGRTGDTASALPILLSVLRARRTAPLALPDAFPLDFGPPKPETDIGAFFDFFRRLLRPTPFPPPPPSGDLPLTRNTEQPTCEEGELMVYVGEIIFASAAASLAGGPEQQMRTEGIGWTRQGALTAGMNLKGRAEKVDGEKVDAGTRERRKAEERKCKECFLTGVRNWETMLKLVSSQRQSNEGREGGKGRRSGWFGWGKETLEERPAEDLEAELVEVEKMKERILREGIEEDLRRSMPSGPWLGF